MSYAKAAGAGAQSSPSNGSQNCSQRFHKKNMVVCFANGIDF